MTKKYRVTIREVLTYNIEVEAESANKAEELAFASEDFSQNNFQDNDADTTSIIELTEFESSL